MSLKILLINPPNCGKSIPEERYGIDSIKQILRGEPLGLEVLAAGLLPYEVNLLDLKAADPSLENVLAAQRPDVVGITGMTCEANTMVRIAEKVKALTDATVVVGGIHASIQPDFFNRPEIDYIVVGLGKASFRELVDVLAADGSAVHIPGVIRTNPSGPLTWLPRKYGAADLMEEVGPRYDLVEGWRDKYFLPNLGIQMGFVVTAYGCPFRCNFCAIQGQTGGQYLSHAVDGIIRDIKSLGDIPVIRLVDANTFGDPEHARKICRRIMAEGISKDFMADIRVDTVLAHTDLLVEWKKAGLRMVVVGFEEINDQRLSAMNKKIAVAHSIKAIRILKEIGLSVVADFIISPDYDEAQFDALETFVRDNPVNLPMYTVMTPLPGTPIHAEMKDRIIIDDLDYYTLTNAVTPTRLEESVFYEKYAALLSAGHENVQI